MAQASAIALLQLSGHVGRIHVVHGTQVLLHVHADTQRIGRANHHTNPQLVHRIGNLLTLFLAGAAIHDGNLFTWNAALHQALHQVAHGGEGFDRLIGLFTSLIAAYRALL